jgi:rhodanese-related sulfurtransferase
MTTLTFADVQARLGGKPFVGYYASTGKGMQSLDELDLISHIEDNLYVGGCLNGIDLGDFFDYVFSMYKWEAYAVAPTTKVHTVTMYDKHGEVDALEIDDLANRVADALDTGKNVLVHCQAGVNRSNLVAAAALVKRGRTPVEAINLLREKRGKVVLANPDFEAHIRGLSNEEA